MKFEIGKKYRYRKGKIVTVLSRMERTGMFVIGDADGKIYYIDAKDEDEKNWKEIKA